MAHTNCSNAVRSWGALVAATAFFQLFAGCATTAGCDPTRDQGLGSALTCTFSSDGYKKRVEDRQLAIAKEQRATQQLADEKKAVDATINATDKQLISARKKANRVDRQLHDVNTQLRRLK